MNKIDAQHVNFFYGDFQALKDISMAIEEKAVVAFIGRRAAESLPFSVSLIV